MKYSTKGIGQGFRVEEITECDHVMPGYTCRDCEAKEGWFNLSEKDKYSILRMERLLEKCVTKFSKEELNIYVELEEYLSSKNLSVCDIPSNIKRN